ncbi:LamG-like jellyroll fold domain-containing protein [uncultured Enterococcus sp.]|uniref:LamG-like jellyroll fold domain-containing protein n=1 Tax=uncultured Enterococcus sp. TaxID=167972 RepID=UPI002AA5F1B8|nr:LamG-like jellyroll fold domain-containing protein [uncultured Enterococcus sp.]
MTRKVQHRLKQAALVFIAIAIGLFMGIESNAESTTTGNLLKNGSFESGLADWTISNPSAAGVDGNNAYGGGGKKLWFYSPSNYTVEASQKVTNLENGVYIVSAMVQQNLNSPYKSELQVDLMDGQIVSVPLKHSNNYQLVRTTVTVTKGEVKVGFYQQAKGANLQIDNVLLEKAAAEKSLLAHWDFDQTSGNVVKDITGNGYDGKLNQLPNFESGVVGNSLVFDGNSQYMAVNHSENLNFTKEDSYTLATWVKLPYDNQSWQALLQKGRDTASFYGLWAAGFPESKNSFAFGGGNLAGQGKANEWVHLVAVQLGGKSRQFYINGNLVRFGEPIDASSPSDLMIGAARHSVGGAVTEYFKGAMDETQIYNYALSSTEIDSLYRPEISDRLTVHFEVAPKNAKVTLRGKDGVVPASSNHLYKELKKGYYTYRIELEGFESVTGEIDLSAVDEDQVIPINMIKLTDKETIINAQTIQNQIQGGWAGQMVGVSWGALTEFEYYGKMIPQKPKWNGINAAFTQDDLYMEVPFLKSMKDGGVNVRPQIIGNYFANTDFNLWHGNRVARYNIKMRGIPATESGHYSNMYDAIGEGQEKVPNLNTSQNPLLGCAEDIDFQIESDSLGMMSVGQPNVAKELSYRFGHIIGYGGGVYGGVFTSTMYAKAYTAKSVNEIVQTGIEAIPEGTETRELLEEVHYYYKSGKSIETTWQRIEEVWQNDRCTHMHADTDISEGNIDTKIASAYILMGLLYGEGDFENSMWLAMSCGQDSDCTPSSVGGILGVYYGFNKIPSKWTDGLNRAKKFDNTYTFDEATKLNMELAQEALEMSGGSVSNGLWTIPAAKTEKSLIVENWPREENNRPQFQYVQADVDNTDSSQKTFKFSAAATDDDGIADYQWFFGDLDFDSGKELTHTYKKSGVYYPVCYVTDTIGNTNVYHFKLEVNNGLIAKWDFESVIDGVVEDASGNGHTGKTVNDVQVTTGKFGQGVRLTGSQYIEVPHQESLNLNITDSYTLSAWSKQEILVDNWQTIFQKGRETNTYYGLWRLSNDRYALGRYGNNIEVGTVKRNEWNLLTAVYDADQHVYRMYINGALVETKYNQPYLTMRNNQNLLIGGRYSANLEYYKGQLDDIRIYKKALTTQDVSHLYNGEI